MNFLNRLGRRELLLSIPSLASIIVVIVLARLLTDPSSTDRSTAQIVQITPTQSAANQVTPSAHTIPTAVQSTPIAVVPTELPTHTPLPVYTSTQAPEPTSSSTPTVPKLDVEDWKNWPVIPYVSENSRAIYQRGLAQGNDPRVFSILGDCQSLPETFLGVYDKDSTLVQELSPGLQETVAHFFGSFSRIGPTLKNGTTSAAVLWYAWHEGNYGCGANERPLDCEIRLSNPSIAIINLGTHYETRNIDYLRRVIETLIENGTLPILSTKADNRELDDRLNQEMAQLAVEYDIPLWNFYAAVSSLPNNGVSTKVGEEHLGVIYLIPEALEIHRFTALQALDSVWKALR